MSRTASSIFRGSRLARFSWWLVQGLFLLAALAPLLANRSPLMVSSDQGLEFPVFREMQAEDGTWLGLLAIYAALRLALRRERRNNPDRTLLECRSPRWAALAAGFCLLAFLQWPPRWFPADWSRWDSLATEGAAADEWVVWPPVPHHPDYIISDPTLPPSGLHFLGTDLAGRDVLSRVIYGTRVSLLVGLMAALMAMLLGVTVGALAGYFGGWLDLLLSRVLEVILCFPPLFFLLIVFAYLPRGVMSLVLVLGVLGWTQVARLTRAEFQRLRNQPFALASRALGASPWRIMVKHLLPHCMAPVLVAAAFGVSSAILAEASLSFLGFGVPDPIPSWGKMLQEGQGDMLREAPWLTVFPGALVFLATAAFHWLGDSLRSSLDPRQGD